MKVYDFSFKTAFMDLEVGDEFIVDKIESYVSESGTIRYQVELRLIDKIKETEIEVKYNEINQ